MAVKKATKHISSAEKVLTYFLTCWNAKNYDAMYRKSHKTFQLNHPQSSMKDLFGDHHLSKWEIIEAEQTDRARCTFSVKLSYVPLKERIQEIHVIAEQKPNKPHPRGEWGVNPLSVLSQKESPHYHIAGSVEAYDSILG